MKLVHEPKFAVLLTITAVISLVLIMFSSSLFEGVNADQIMVVQSPVKGTLTWYTSPGWKWQGFGRVTKYYKLDTYEFEIQIRFNDGGHGTVHGSINYELPLDINHLNNLNEKYGSQEAIQKQLIETVTNKCVYMTGPLMSSKESYAEKRTTLISYIEDQIANGVFKTSQRDVKSKDPITGAEKTVTIVEIVKADNGTAARQEKSVLTEYGIRTSNFAINKLPYDTAVENQIKQQQELTMKVQTAVASAKEAEQRAITVAKEGEANAAKAKWDQEVIKAKEVTMAEQRLAVARLDREAADELRKKLILEGEGESEKRKLIMGADGALAQKLDTYLKSIEMLANAFGKQKWVPEIMMGQGTAGTTNAATDMISLLMTKTAKDLALDMSVQESQP